MLPDRTSFDRWQRVARAIGLAALVIGGLVAAGESWSDRRARVERMSPAEKDQLLRQQQRFAQLDPAEQQRLRAFAAELDQAPDGSELRQVLDRYYQWLLTLPGIQRAQLLQLEPERRLQRIKQMKADETRLAAHRLSPSDVQAVSNWLERRVMDNVQPAMREQLQQLPPAERHRRIVGMIWQRSQSPEGFKGPGLVKPGDMQGLRAELSESARKQLNQALDDRMVGQLMGDWVKQALGGYFGGGRPMAAGGRGVSEERLTQFFEHELPERERQQLLTLPADELHNQLRRLYYLHMQGGSPGALPGNGAGPRRPMRVPNPPGESGRKPSSPPPSGLQDPPRDGR
jgi:hypothetical protein